MSFLDVERNYGGPSRNSSSSSSSSSSDRSFTSRSDPQDFHSSASAQARIYKQIEQISTNVPQISKMLQRIGTTQDGNELRENLRNLIGKTRNIVKEANQDIKDFSHEDGPKNKILQAKLMKDFQMWCQKFQEVTKLSAQKEREIPLPSKANNSRTMPASPFSHDNDFQQEEEEKKALLSNARMQFVQLENDREFNEMQIEEREQGIKEIETTILEVNEITRDLSHLVHEQGRMIDNIESHIDTTVQQTAIGLQEISKAADHQNTGRKNLCCILLILVIAMIVIIGIIVTPILIKLAANS